jgi:hypothetical protein
MMLRVLTNEHLPLAQPRRVAVLLAGRVAPDTRCSSHLARHTSHVTCHTSPLLQVRFVVFSYTGTV